MQRLRSTWGLYVNGHVTLSVQAQGSYPLAYAWSKDGQPLPGAAASSLTLSRLTPGDAGQFQVRISNGAGAVASTSVLLTILPITETGYRGLIINDAPVAYFPLDDVEGSATAREIYQQGILEGSNQGPPALQQPGATAATGFAADFDGANQAILISATETLNFTGQVTLEAWVKAGIAYGSGAYGNIIAHGYAGNPTRELALRLADGSYRIGSYDGSSYGVSVPVPAGDLNHWVHLVGTYDGTAWNLYRNGLLAGRAVSPTGALTVDGDWAIGARGTGTERFFQGSVDEVAIYDYALTPSQVARHFLTAAGQPAALSITRNEGQAVLHWNAGQLEEATDLAGPWQPLPAAIPPYQTERSGAQKFFRIRW